MLTPFEVAAVVVAFAAVVVLALFEHYNRRDERERQRHTR